VELEEQKKMIEDQRREIIKGQSVAKAEVEEGPTPKDGRCCLVM